MTAAPRTSILRIDARAAVDAAGAFASPASILIEVIPPGDGSFRGAEAPWHARLLALGRPSEVHAHPAASSPGVEQVHRPNSVLMPGLVNAHAHLDLTHIGPRPHDPVLGFVPWVDMVRSERHADEDAIAASVRRGIDLSLAAGTVAIGDIAGAPRGRPTLAPWRAMRDSGLRGVSFLEFFGIGRSADDRLAAVLGTLRSANGAAGDPRLGLQPHAPNTVARRVFREIRRLAATIGTPTCTHLAETPEEREFIACARGPQRELLERLHAWDDSILEDIGRGQHPVTYLADALPGLVAHVNDADDAAIETLARAGTSVAYCPLASEYFGAARHFGPHRYRDMLSAGINVAVGTDSIVNLPPGSDRLPDPSSPLDTAGGLSVLREVRRLFRRDGAGAAGGRDLLAMATINGARALGLDARAFVLSVDGPVAGLLAIPVALSRPIDRPADAIRAVLDSTASPELLFADNRSGLVGILADRHP